MEELRQRKLFSTKIFKINDYGIHIIEKSLGSYNEITLPFEKITTDIHIYTEVFKHNLGVSIVFLNFSLLIISGILFSNDKSNGAEYVWFFMSLLFFIMYWVRRAKYLKICCTETIDLLFFLNRNNRQKVNEFVKAVFDKRNDYLANKYAKVDRELSYEENYNHFIELKEDKVISEDELFELIRQLYNTDYKKQKLNETNNEVDRAFCQDDKCLLQKNIMGSRKLEITDSGVNLKVQESGEYFERTIPFYNITDETRVTKKSKKFWIGMCIFSIIIALLDGLYDKEFGIMSFWIILSVIYISLYIFANRKYLLLMCNNGNTAIYFLNNKKYITTVRVFIEQILTYKKNYYRDRYAYIDNICPYEQQIDRLSWLLKNEYISDEEFSELKMKLKNINHMSIGFRFKSDDNTN